MRRLILAIVTALTIAGCGSSAAPERSSDVPELRFEFELESDPGFISQTLTIENPGDSAVAPVLEFTALDVAGEPMPDTEVRTAYGSDQGRVVVPPRWGVIDVLRFEGPGAREVEDVEVHVSRADEVPLEPVTEEAEIQRLDNGRPVEYEHLFDAFRLTNPNDAEVKVRVVLIEYEDPPEGESQQWIRVTPLAPLTTLAADGEKTIRLPARLRGRVIGSVKSYFSR